MARDAYFYDSSCIFADPASHRLGILQEREYHEASPKDLHKFIFEKLR